MLVIVNPHANAGEGARRWTRVAKQLRDEGVAHEARMVSDVREIPPLLEGLADGTCVVAAGGDGTVNVVLNSLMDTQRDRPLRDLTLGAIGLGSSNDFHKPPSGRSIAGFPARISRDDAVAVDVGKAVLGHADGGETVRYFLLNASLGFVATGNAYFNTDRRVLRCLKRVHVEMAILYTIMVNLLTFKPLKLSLRLDEEPEIALTLSNLAVLKKPHFAGGMRYDTPVSPVDGMFDINVWKRMGRCGLVRTLAALYRGRFKGRPDTECWRGRTLRVTPETPVLLELDGEITPIRQARFSVLPRILRLCS